MADLIVVLVVIVLLGFALKGTVKHFKGEGPCCGGGGGSAVKAAGGKKLSGPVIGTKTVRISGMHCDRCAESVTKAINKIDGASAKVSLKKETAVVSYDRELDNGRLKEAVQKAGYDVVTIEG